MSLRREPVTRDIPNTDLQETVEGTLIPIVGSEETNIVTWLNQIVSLFTCITDNAQVFSDPALLGILKDHYSDHLDVVCVHHQRNGFP